MLGDGGVALAVALVGDADLDLVEAAEDVELGDREVGETVDARGVVDDDRVVPAAATLASGGDAVLMADLAEKVARLVEELRGERARADAGEVGLGDAEDALDLGGADAGAGDRAARGAV